MIANLKKNKKKGFTMVELIVVIAIIAIIAAVAVPTTISYVQQARENTAKSETGSVMSVIETYFTQFSSEMTASNNTITADSLAAELNEKMATVQYTTGVAVEVEGTVITVTVNASEDAAKAEKTFDGSVYGFNISAMSLNAPGSADGVTAWTPAA